MKLQQLRYIWEVARNDLNISQTAEKLFTSQPGISKQIRLLEEELGTPIFHRNGKHLSHITAAGAKIIETAGEILHKADSIRAMASELEDGSRGSLSLATTHTQSRYVLPAVIRSFIQRYPDVSLHMHQGTPMQISRLAADGTADFAIATEALETFEGMIMLPCFHWNRSVLVPKGHALTRQATIDLQDIARHPLVTYVHGFTGRSKLDDAFRNAGLEPKVVFTAADADVIKTYVRLGLGVGIIASLAWEPERDRDLVAIDASHLFERSTTNIGFRKEIFLRAYMYDFISTFAPHLTKELVQEAVGRAGRAEREMLFQDISIPML